MTKWKNTAKTYLSATIVLIIINVIIFILANISSGVYENMVLVNLYIYFGQIWRLITPMFLHTDILHIASNMYALYIAGSELETVFGAKKLILVYVLSGLGGTILSYLGSIVPVILGGQNVYHYFNCSTSSGQCLFYPPTDPTNLHLSLGASGAVFGIYGYLFAKMKFREREMAMNGEHIMIEPTSLLAVIAFNLIYGFTPGSHIDNLGHIGGLIIGFVLGLIF